MSQRHFFSFRYSIPGYTFIVLIIGTNHALLLEVLTSRGFESVFVAFLAFLSLLSGSAIGFLISQFWHWKFQKKTGILGVKQFEGAIETLLDKFKLKKPENEEEKRRLLAVYDYVSHSEKRKRIFILAQRRWDLYHALKSTYHSLWIGFTIGIIYRFLCELFISPSHYTIPFQNWVSVLSNNLEPWLLLSLFIIVALLLYFLRKGAEWTVTEYAALAEARIRDSKVEPIDLKNAFPDAFPKASS